MQPITVSVIVPRLPPAIDGLGDYGLLLGDKIFQLAGIKSEFIVCDPEWNGHPVINGFNVRKLSKRSQVDLFDLVKDSHIVLLHYVGYGYARRGSPIWLINALESWKRHNVENKLITMFHELYAFGPIWTSQFWTSGLQKLLFKRLVSISDECATSKSAYAEIIKNTDTRKDHVVDYLPVFSNVGEPIKNIPLNQRHRRLIVFGGPGPRTRVYQKSYAELEKVCSDFEIEEIIDIGKPLVFKLTEISGYPVKYLGELSASEISHLLSTSLVGFFNYPLGFLSKSGIFAAYSSHGMLPIGTNYTDQDTDDVLRGIHYLVYDGDKESLAKLDIQKIADNAFTWYQGHTISFHADLFIRLILNERH